MIIDTSEFLFIGYYKIDDLRSAPKVRISELSKSFSKTGTKYFIIGNRWKRTWLQLKFMLTWQGNLIKYVYLENSTSTAWPMDFLFLLFLKYKKIKIGIFIRDAHPPFDRFYRNLRWYQKPLYKGWFPTIKFFLKIADIIYVPTEDLLKYLPDMPEEYAILPPGLKPCRGNLFNKESKKFLYIGNINKRYGIDVIKNCLQLLADHGPQYSITIISNNKDAFKLASYKNCEIINLPYDKVPDLQDKFLAGINTSRGYYNDIALSVKLFDYLSLRLPVIIVNSKTNSQFVQKEKIGLVAKNAEEFPKLLLKSLKNNDELENISKKICNELGNKLSWDARRDTIAKTLSVQ